MSIGKLTRKPKQFVLAMVLNSDPQDTLFFKIVTYVTPLYSTLATQLVAHIQLWPRFAEIFSGNTTRKRPQPLPWVKPLSRVKPTNLQLLNKFSTTTPRKLNPLCSSKRQFNNHEAIYTALHFSSARPEFQPFSNPSRWANEIIASAR